MMKQNLLALIERASSRGYVRALKRNEVLLAWVMEVSSSLPEDAELAERVYVALHGVETAFCHRGNHKIFNTLEKGFRFCAAGCQCRREEQSRKITENQANVSEAERARRGALQRSTMLENHGVENPMQSAEIRAKIAITNQERYGAPTPFQSESVQAKIQATSLLKYGVEHPFSSAEIREKGRLTTIANHGSVENCMKIARDAFTKEHGCNPFQIPEIMARAKASMLSLYGVEKALQSPTILKLMYDKHEEKYGVKNVMQRPEIVERLASKNVLKYNRRSPNQAHFLDTSYTILTDEVAFRKMFEGRSLREVATELKIAYDTARKWCDHYKIDLPRSTYEDAIRDFLTLHGAVCGRADRTVIRPYEIDIPIHDMKLGIEFCGLYWHCDAHDAKKDEGYHKQKTIMSQEAGWRLITIFEDEWVYKREIVEKRLLNALGLSPRGPGARSLKIRTITSKEAARFLDQNHLQGGRVYGFANYGAFEGETLVAVMTFAHARIAMGRREGPPELLRFATDGRNMPGLASKLFAKFVNDYNPDEVLTYADRRWSEGRLYEAMGFENVGTTKPNYWYFHSSKLAREYRFKFRKDRIKHLVEGGEEMTERAIMDQLGYHRLWDCGHHRFKWTKPLA